AARPAQPGSARTGTADRPSRGRRRDAKTQALWVPPMVTMFGRQRTEGGLDARIAELSARRARVDGTTEPANTVLPERPAAPVPAGTPVPVGAPVSIGEPEATIEERLAV